MEGIYWVRIGAVFVLFFGSIWILLPTVLRESADTRFREAADEVEAPAHQGPELDLTLPVTAGEPMALSEVLETRLRVAQVPVASVKPDANTVLVKLAAGGTREAVTRLAEAPGKATVHALDAVIPLDPKGAVPPGTPALSGPPLEAVKAALGADADYWATQIPKLATAAQGVDAVALPVSIAKAEATESGATITWAEGQPYPPGVPIGAVAVDGKVAGFVLPSGSFYMVGDSLDQAAMVVSGPMPGKLAAPLPPSTTPESGDEATPVATSKVPAWFLRMLPNTAISLGLDLQGGIDLTVQVDLDAAILGQVARDTAYLKETAAKEGVILDSVRRAHSQPIIEVSTASPLAEVTKLMRSRAPEYVYVDSQETTHRFELSESRQEQVRDQAVEQVLETLRKRVDATGVKEPSIVKKTGGRINVQLPGMEDVQAAVDAIGTTAVLEFRMVDEEFDDSYLEQMLKAAEQAMPPDQFLDDELLNIWLWENNRLDEDKMVLWEYAVDPVTKEEARAQPLPLNGEVVLTGNDVNDAGVGWDQNQQAFVTLEFKPRGGQIFCDITGQAVGKRFAVILDQKIQSAPSIRERICGGAARIEMGGAEDPTREAQALALVLRTGALDAPVVVASVQQVGASLGADAIREGTLAAVLGSLLVYIYMVLWYKFAGVIADIALTVHVLMMLAALAAFGATLTLPGIAGIALTVGMAVDANILIYERIREELRLGVHPRKAVAVGFEKAFVAIVDSNVTTSIAGIVMYSYGSGPLKGFAVSLLAGIATTIITAVFVTRTIMDQFTRNSATRLSI